MTAERYKQPEFIIAHRACQACGFEFAVSRRYPAQRFCSRRCGFKAINPPDHNANVSRATAKKRGDVQRGRGEGKSYPKLYGRHAHRVVAERKIGRQLKKGEVVHHGDENKLNYSPENLEVLPSQAAHAKLHFTGHRKP